MQWNFAQAWVKSTWEIKRKKVMAAKKRVKAPSGYHWMKDGKKAPKLMKHTGKFVPHKGASLYASFDIQKLHKKK